MLFKRTRAGFLACLLAFQLGACGSKDEKSEHPEANHSPIAESHEVHGGHAEHDAGGDHQEHEEHSEHSETEEHDGHGNDHDAHGEDDKHSKSDDHGGHKEADEHGKSDGHGGADKHGDSAALPVELSQAVSESLSRGESNDALAKAKEAVIHAREQDNQKMLVTSLHNLGKVHMALGEIDQSIGLFEEALEAGRGLPETDRKLLALCLNKLASAHYANKESKLARSALKSALDSAHGELGLEIQILQNLVKVCNQQGDAQSAAHFLERARVLTVKQGDPAPCEGLSLRWVSVVWPKRFYRPSALLFAEREFPVNRASAPSRFMAREYPSLEEEVESSSGGH